MADFNLPPYFDDYDESKGFYKILFRPSVAIQARELNQMQSMVQKQIERFGSHIFREGSVVVGGAFDLQLDMAYVTASAVFPSFSNIQDFVGQTITGATTGITAVVIAATYDTDNKLAVFMIRYLDSSTTTAVFLDSEVIKVTDSLYFTANSSSSTGKGSTFGIGEGVIFSKGYFIAFPKQTIILTDLNETTIPLKYTQTPSLTIGLQLTETIVTDLIDSTLLDNAAGSYNENAPGAHRYAIDATLTAIPYRESYQNPDFAVMLNIKQGHVEESNERSEYARIYEELAKRTFDESGDYFVRGLGIRTREHLDTGINEGLYTTAGGGDPTKLSIDVEAGLAYVKGYEVNKLSTTHVITDKSLAYANVNNQRINARTGGYLYITQTVGSPILDQGTLVGLYSNPEYRANNLTLSTASPTGTFLGSARVKSMIFDSGSPESGDAYFKLYLYDVNMNTGYTFNQARSVGNTSSGGFFADIDLSGINGNIGSAANAAALQEKNNNDLLFDIGSEHIRSIRGAGIDTSFAFHRTDYPVTAVFNNTTPSYGVLTINVATSSVGESLDYGTGWLSSSEKRSIIITAANQINIPLVPSAAYGNVTATGSIANITGQNTYFSTQFNSGEKILVNGTAYRVNTVFSNTLMSLSTVPSAFSGNVYSKRIDFGDMIDLTNTGSNGAIRTANVSGGVMTIDMKEDTRWMSTNNASFKVTYNVARQTAGEIKKILKPNRYVQIRVATNAAGKTGPFNLGLSDVYKIRFIKLITSASSTTPFTDISPETQGTDVTSQFTLYNGQTDNYYDHAKLYNSGSLDLTNAWLLVKLDHFEPDYSTGIGYFSIDSYPINDAEADDTSIFTYQIPKYTSSSGVLYNLRNVLDFRPVKPATASSSTLVLTSTTNPATTSSLITDPYGLRTAIPDSTIIADYSYYLGRIDVVTLDKNREFAVLQGEASKNPKARIASDSVMTLAKVYIPPYPSISETLGRIINDRAIACVSKKIATIRYTMRDIGTIKSRVDTLEYYNALTLLEKNAKDLKIVNDQGLDRFKNGFFVDGFLDHSLGATTSPDYRVSIDKIETCIRPFFEMEAFPFKYDSSISTGVQTTGNLITRPYGEVILLENKNVTSYRNVEQGVFRFLGVMELTPDSDNWVDLSTYDKTVPVGGEPVNYHSTTWGSWEKHITGYSIYDRKIGDRTGTVYPANFQKGGFSSYAEAQTWAKKNDADGRYLIVTDYENVRTGEEVSVGSEEQVNDLGSFVTDVSVAEYIRPQVIGIYTRGLKPNTLFYLYFDNENMSSYTTKMTRLTDFTGSTQDFALVTIDDILFVQGEEGVTALRSDAYGELICLLRLPEEGKRFRTGTKEVTLTDSPTNAIDATTYATSYFVASGLNVTKQNTMISTKIPVYKHTPLSQTQIRQSSEVMGPSCMAYSFKVDIPPTEDGIFLTSVDVWFQNIHPTLGVWFEIREMENGQVTRNQIPYSEVWLNRLIDDPLNPGTKIDNPNLKTWAGTAGTEETNKTNVKFSCPVFLMNNTEYAFVIHTEGLNPDYYMWTSRLTEFDKLTNKQVTGRQLTGTLYTTNNNLNYDMVPDVDLKVRFNRAQFSTGSGTAYFGNVPVEMPIFKSGVGNFIKSGETVKSSQYLSLSTLSSTPSGNTVIVGDKVYVAAKNLYGNVISNTGYIYTDNIGYTAGDSYSILNSANVAKSITGSINTSGVFGGVGTMRSFDPNTNKMLIDNVEGLFFANCVITGMSSGAKGQVDSFSYYPYSTTNLKPYYVTFKNTGCTFEKQGFVYGSGLGDWYPGIPDGSSDFSVEHRILSRVDEVSNSVTHSAYFKAILSTDSEYVSPAVDANRAQQIVVHNIINSYDPDVITLANTINGTGNTVIVGDKITGTTSGTIASVVSIVANVVTTDTNGFVAGETFTVTSSGLVSKAISNTISTVVQSENLPSGGYLYNKYISKTVTLADGQDAEDLNIKLTVYRPIDTEIKVWVKIKNAEDGDLFDTKPYILMEYNKDFYSSGANIGNYIEIDYTFPLSYLGTDPSTGTTEVVNYTRADGTKFYGFKQFAVKIGLFGTDSANIPKVADLRAIALQK